MIDFEKVTAPEGEDSNDLFVKLVGFHKVYCVKKKMQTTSQNQPVISFIAYPIGEETLTSSLSHTFTSAELTDPEFNQTAVIRGMVKEVVNKIHNEAEARENLMVFNEGWGGL